MMIILRAALISSISCNLSLRRESGLERGWTGDEHQEKHQLEGKSKHQKRVSVITETLRPNASQTAYRSNSLCTNIKSPL
jgi:hypothetical protein